MKEIKKRDKRRDKDQTLVTLFAFSQLRGVTTSVTGVTATIPAA
jgi:ribosomal protein S12